MSGATDWLGAVGGAIGAIGGPAGVWAAWQQHQQQKREQARQNQLEAARQLAPPAEVLDLLVQVRAMTVAVEQSYRDRAWFDASPGHQALARLTELLPLLKGILQAKVALSLAACSSLKVNTTFTGQSTDAQSGTIARQMTAAIEAKPAVDSAIETVQAALHRAIG